MDTKALLEHHLEAFLAGDSEEIIKDYTDESILITADGVIRGRKALQEAFSSFFSGLFKPGTYEITMDASHIEGDVAYVVWHASCGSAEVPLGTDTLICRNGKIATQTFAAKIDPK